MAGRRPKPVGQKILAGNPGRRKLPRNEPRPAAGVPTCPDWLSREAKDEWRRIVPELCAARLLSLTDRVALAAYCQAWAELVIATRLLDKEQRVAEGKAHPAVKQQRDAFVRLKSFLIEFGLSPASRTKAAAAAEPESARDPMAEFLKHGQSCGKAKG